MKNVKYVAIIFNQFKTLRPDTAGAVLYEVPIVSEAWKHLVSSKNDSMLEMIKTPVKDRDIFRSKINASSRGRAHDLVSARQTHYQLCAMVTRIYSSPIHK